MIFLPQKECISTEIQYLIGNKMSKPLHIEIGKSLKTTELSESKIILGEDCGKKQTIKLFSNKLIYSEPDIIILKEDMVRVIIEIEESNQTPRKLLGKVFAAGLANKSSVKKKEFDIAPSVLFIQILSNHPKQRKGNEVTEYRKNQWKSIAKWINNSLPINGCCIKHYELIVGDISDFADIKSNKCIHFFNIVQKGVSPKPSYSEEMTVPVNHIPG